MKSKSFFPIVGIGASAGGMEAVVQLLQYIPSDTGLAFVVIQHLDPTHKSILSDILGKATKMPVREATDAMAMKRDHVYVVPPNFDIQLEGAELRLVPRKKDRGLHMPIDYFFRSLAQDRGHQAIGMILSGTGSDGSLGISEIKDRGGITFAQDEQTAKFFGMPHSAIATGSVDFILPMQGIARELIRIAQHPYIFAPDAPEQKAKPLPADVEQDKFLKILKLLRGAMGIDFTSYKNTTIARRIARRMALHKIDHFEDYTAYLKKNPTELRALYHDLLIKVTSFFRDPGAFEALKEKVIPRLLENRPAEQPIRIWVPGCATGEEAYSIAICFIESLQDAGLDTSIRIFATDIDETALQRARAGLYVENIAADVTPERLGRFFTKTEQHYRINNSIREMCTFARHDLIKDPPFSNLDLVSCRNVLIYFDSTLQKRVLPIFHYALNPKGYLTLGVSESVGTFTNLFTPADKTYKIYTKKHVPTPVSMDFVPRVSPVDGNKKLSLKESKDGASWKEMDIGREADRALLNYYSPAGVLINEPMEILQFRGQTERYLMPAPGKASFNLLRMAREGLLGELKTAIQQAQKKGVPIYRQGVPLRYDGKLLSVNLKIIPVKLSNSGAHHFMVLFEETPLGVEVKKGRAKALSEREIESRENAALREDLEAAKQHLQSIIEGQDSINEELRSANEEVLSGNEELRSTNEELETSKEELQSTNEELSTVNEELLQRITELNRANSDLSNLFSSANLPLVMLGKDLRIRRFTKAAEQTLNIIPSDIGRPVGHLKLNIQIPELEPLISSVIKTAGAKELEVQDRKGRWFSLQARPYKTIEGKIDGAVLMFVDINSIKGIEKLTHSLEELQIARNYSEGIVQTVREPLLILSADLHVLSANPSFYRVFKLSKEETEGSYIYELGGGGGDWDIPKLRKLLENVLPKDNAFQDFEVEREFRSIGHRTMLFSGRKIALDGAGTQTILLAIEDVTERKRAKEQLQMFNIQLEQKVTERTRELAASNKEMESFSYSVAHDLRTPIRSIVSFSQIVLKKGEKLDPELKSYLERAMDAGKRMAKLIDALLELARLTRQDLRSETVDLSSEARSIAGQLTKENPERQVEFRIQAGLETKGDLALLRLALRNMLENAWKFTGHTPQAVIEVGQFLKDGKKVFFVRDNGAGFDMAYADKLFGVFRRLHEEKDFPGTGIGLVTVHRIIHRHGGDVWAEGKVNGGATFYFSFPKS